MLSLAAIVNKSWFVVKLMFYHVYFKFILYLSHSCVKSNFC